MHGKLLIVAMVGVFLLGFAGISHGDGSMHRSDWSKSGAMSTMPMEKSSDVEAPSSDSWQYFEATETGNLPHLAESSPEPSRKGPPVRWDSSRATTTIGGLEFRNIDIGP